MLNHRHGNVLKTGSDSNPEFAASYLVYVAPAGAVQASGTGTSPITVHAGHSFIVGDKFIVGTDTTKYRTVTAVTATTITFAVGGTVSSAAGDLLVNLGPDTGGGAPVLDALPTVIYSDPAGTTAISGSKITTDAEGDYEYYSRMDGREWRLVASSGVVLTEILQGEGGVTGRINVADFGAAVDGTTDDSKRVVASCIAAAVDGKTVFFPEGTTLMDSAGADMSGDGMTLAGTGPKSIVKAGANQAFTGSSMVLVTADDTTIRDLTLDCGRIAQHCVEITGARARHTCRDCILDGATVAGHRTQGAANVITGLEIIDCLFDDCDYGVYVVDTASSKIRVRGNRFIETSVSDTINGVNMDRDAFDIIVSGNHCETSGYGIAVASCTDVIIDGNHCTGQDDATRGRGIHLESTSSEIVLQRVTVTNNIISNVENSGIGVVASATGNSKDIVIANNIVKGKASAANPAGINVDDVENCVIAGNTVDTFDLHGINLLATNSTTKNVVISNNICYNNNISANAAGANINVAGSTADVLVQGNRCYDDQGAPTVRFHIRAVPTDGSVAVRDNFVDANAVTTPYSYTFEKATGTITLVPTGQTSIDSSAGAVTATLGNGDQIGDVKTVVMTEASTSSTLSVTNHETSDPEVITFAAVDDTAVLMWTGTEWVTIKLSGATV